MLTNLHIQNIAVIESTDIDFSRGLNVLTGETGAGKTIIIDSIETVLGGRADRSLIRHGTDSAIITATFVTSSADNLLKEYDIEPDGELILQRKLSSDGKTSCRINGIPVTLKQLHNVGSLLLDIHGQNDGRKLLDENNHLGYLDSYAGLDGELEEYRVQFKMLKDLEKQHRSSILDEREKLLELDRLNYQISELESAALQPGEEEELTERFHMMRNAEKIRTSLEDSYECVYRSDDSALSMCGAAVSQCNKISGLLPALAAVSESLQSAYCSLDDAAEQLRDLLDGLDFSQKELDDTSARLNLIHSLQKKYGSDIDSILRHLAECKERVNNLELSDVLAAELAKKIEVQKNLVLSVAQKLSQSRKKAALSLADSVAEQLKYLNMPSVKFVISVEQSTELTANGLDTAKFLMSANAGEAPGRISKIASGGELSRIMLAMKCAFSKSEPTESMVFDEIDTGVSGITAQRVAEKLRELSNGKQILCITHLPQLASMADEQYEILKQERNGSTFTVINKLDRKGRIRELARLYGGDTVTATTLKTAEEQLDACKRTN